MPALGAVSIGIALGLLSLPSIARRLSATYVLAGITLAGITLAACISPLTVIAPIYTLPKLLDSVSPPPTMQVPMSLNYANKIQLLGYSMPMTKTVQTGDS